MPKVISVRVNSAHSDASGSASSISMRTEACPRSSGAARKSCRRSVAREGPSVGRNCESLRCDRNAPVFMSKARTVTLAARVRISS